MVASITPPAESSTATKVLIFIGAVLGIVAGLSLPASAPTWITEYAGIGATVFVAVGTAWHVFFDTG
jgi:hypothetical protein